MGTIKDGMRIRGCEINRIIATVLLVLFSSVISPAITSADIVCPKGSLNDFLAVQYVWKKYLSTNGNHVKSNLRRLSIGIGKVAGSENINKQIKEAQLLGRDNLTIMQRMFEEGFIAATDIIYAYCVKRQIDEQWSKEIKKKRRMAWCRKEKSAHFCNEK